MQTNKTTNVILGVIALALIIIIVFLFINKNKVSSVPLYQTTNTVQNQPALNQPPQPITSPVTSTNNTPQSPTLQPSSNSSITLLSPNGSEQFIKGNTYQITWETTPAFAAAGYSQVALTLLAGNRQQAVTPQQQIITANTGSYTWTVPTGQLSAYVQSYSGGPYTLQPVTDQTPLYFSIEGYPFPGGMAEGPGDRNDMPFYIVSQ